MQKYLKASRFNSVDWRARGGVKVFRELSAGTVSGELCIAAGVRAKPYAERIPNYMPTDQWLEWVLLSDLFPTNQRRCSDITVRKRRFLLPFFFDAGYCCCSGIVRLQSHTCL